MSCLGNIVNNGVVLNGYGMIVKKQWLWLAQRYSYVVLDEFEIMPNHIHGIIIINVRNGFKPFPTNKTKN